MALKFNNNTPKKIKYNGNNVAKLIFNNVLVWAVKMIKKVTGLSPLTLENSTGENLVDYKIEGNTEQNGTPTPASKVEMESVGDLYNFFDKNNINIYNGFLEKSTMKLRQNNNTFTFFIKCEENTSYTIEKSNSGTNNRFCVFTCNSEPTANLKVTKYNGTPQGVDDSSTLSITSESGDKYLGIFVSVSSTTPSYTEIAESIIVYKTYGKYKIPVNVHSENLAKILRNGMNRNPVSDSGIDFYFNNNAITCTGTNTTGSLGMNFLIAKKFKKGTYTINGLPNKDFGLNDRGTIYLFTDTEPNSGITNADITYTWVFASKTFTVEKDFYIGFRIIFQDVPIGAQINKTFNIQLNEGTQPKPYQPYYNTTTNIYLDAPLRKIGDVADYIDWKEGKVVRNIEEKIFKGNENWIYQGDDGDTSQFRLNKSIGAIATGDNNIDAFCTHFVGKKSGAIATEPCFWFNQQGYIRFRTYKSTASNLSTFLAWLSQNNVELNYILATPTEETIELPEILTTTGNNIISIDTKIQPSNLEIEYIEGGV